MKHCADNFASIETITVLGIKMSENRNHASQEKFSKKHRAPFCSI
jgi:hypothetical protein